MPIYHKLVRDRIPEIIKSTGKSFKTRILDDEEYVNELKKKVSEELAEYMSAESDQEAVEELADLLELIHALTKVHGRNIEEVEAIRQEKVEQRGSFDKKVLLLEVEDD
jgi:predicted house-cleaning noncanonical NTP pyrophosphatase (MazG superfamily)